jgi:hypothetical protein
MQELAFKKVDFFGQGNIQKLPSVTCITATTGTSSIYAELNP